MDRRWRTTPSPAGHFGFGMPPKFADADPALLSVVADLVCELLELTSVDPQDNFFLLGGHSMLGAQLIAHLDELFGVQLPLRDIFRNPTVAAIASAVELAMMADLDVLSDDEAQRLAECPSGLRAAVTTAEGELSLFKLLDPEVLANPYPLYAELRESAPVLWDPYLHAWVVTRYSDVVNVFQNFLAGRTPTPEKLVELGLGQLSPIARVMVRQMLFLDQPDHGRVPGGSPRWPSPPGGSRDCVSESRSWSTDCMDDVQAKGHMDVMTDLANPMPSMVTAELLGVPIEDHEQLKDWSQTFAEMLGNFQHNPGRSPAVLAAVEEMTAYFRSAVRRQALAPTEGLVHALATANVAGDRLDEDDVIANIIVTMVGGLETTTNLIGNGILTLLRNPEALAQLRADPELVPSAVEELLRFESPSQHTARLAPADVMLGGQLIKERQAVIAVMGAANRDPERFPDPDRLDLARTDNRHLAFAWAGHFCFGAPLARLEGQIAFETVLRRLPELRLATEVDGQPEDIRWRPNLGLRGVESLEVSFAPASISAIAS